MLVAVINNISTHKKYKYTAIFSNGKMIHFGSKGYGDLLTGAPIEKKNIFINIYFHKIIQNAKDPYYKTNLCYYIIWGSPDLKKNIEVYNQAFKDYF